ncbi:dTDP-4-dehydrorhamnose reductase [Ruegeria atlantica]|uniref:dTDP-4-dehydrorhamnose reductase n=1 Tax=Ruegeria atlantica TaxID=81569 RepID=UPI0024948093|nr:dTDP-4-dehydrorhamnose reductase [Ruegeria atlantica]
MKVLVFGQTGQVGQELQRCAGDIELEVIGRDIADFSGPNASAECVRTTDADAVINAVAFTAVDGAEEQEASARIVNAVTPGAIAAAAAERGLPFVHISTDYVFDGSGDTPFLPDSPTGPLGAYGRTKLEGEELVRAAEGVHLILRTSWIFSAHGQNFVKTMLRLGAERDEISVVADQVGGPTAARDIAKSCLSSIDQLIRYPEKSGTYHLSGGPDVSWADFAREIFRLSGTQCQVTEIPSSAFPTPAKRPLNSRLDNSSFENTFNVQRPNWQKGLEDTLVELEAFKS